ncbi:uncharacterized protein LOC112043013 isoform X1 [Bicyclus anynana]|uniref:Uncharacterized protein LOC112043013 isoform X1 n=1 Tax=Bicyclus anynana TaxID=110368 RepID=A0A6J1MM43_BICAN|nr:uncharacterized protein LOC112043013 isoform X1 [Bicyclus anynana]
MFNTFWLFAFLSVVLVYGKKATVTIPPEYAGELITASVDCVRDTGVDPDMLNQIVQWKLQENDNVKKFIFCVATATGYGDSDGHVVVDKAEKLLSNSHKKKEEFKNILKECNKISGSDKYDTLYKTAKCNREKQPIVFSL